ATPHTDGRRSKAMNRGRWIPALGLIVVLATCVDQPTPTSSTDQGIQASANLVSNPITQTLLTSGHDPNNVKVFTTASITPAPNALVTVAVLTHQASSAAPAPTLTGGGMAAWTLVASVAHNRPPPPAPGSRFRPSAQAPRRG